MVVAALDINYSDVSLVNALADVKGLPRGGDFVIELYDTSKHQTVRVRARRKIPINKELLETLDSLGIGYKVQTAPSR